MLARLMLTAALLMSCAVAGAQEHDFTAILPARGLIDLDDGTIEYWIKFDFDPLEPVKAWTGRGSAFWFDLGDRAFPNDGWSLTLGSRPFPRGPQQPDGVATVTRFGIVLDGGKYPHPTQTNFPADCARDQWHHFALTWRAGRQSEGFVDGKSTGVYNHTDARQPFTRIVSAAARIGIGHDPRSPYGAPVNLIAIDDLRISSIARRPEDFGFTRGPLKVDAHTLLLIDFDRGEQTVEPNHTAVQPLPTLPLPARWHFIPGHFGRAIALDPAAFAPPAAQPAAQPAAPPAAQPAAP